MNQIKKDLEQELQSVTLSKEKKQLIFKKVKASKLRKTRGSTWSYRFALLTFIVFSLSFGFLLIKQEDGVTEQSTAAGAEIDSSFLSIFTSDWIKGLFLIGIFIAIRIFVKRLLVKRRKGLPVCIACGEEWTYQEALKMSMKNEAVTCPHCGKIQYKTRKSSMRAGALTFFVPLGIITAQFFDHILLAYFLHAAGALWLMITLTPYILEFQEDDPMVKPLY